MRRPLASVWARHDAEWRNPAQIAAGWTEASTTDPDLLRHRVRGAFWEVLESAGITLLVTREYEHLVMALHAQGGRPEVSFLRLPHPSGLAVDRERRVVHVASTRNPNQVLELAPVTGWVARRDVGGPPDARGALVPVQSRFYPGCLYIHDLAIVDGTLHANAVGMNAVVRLDEAGWTRVWWPRCVEAAKGPDFTRNLVQLNSIAAGPSLSASFYSASTDEPSRRRPGHRNFAVDRRGVIFSGATREPIVHGLTRPHSARRHRGRVWVANSGYGELGFADGGRFTPALRLQGWTRGLTFHGDVAFVGTSRVIPRFRQYAPGLDVERSVCGIHAVDVRRGEVLGSLLWPTGNQVFALEWVPVTMSRGFPFRAAGRRATARERALFYTFEARPVARHPRQRGRR